MPETFRPLLTGLTEFLILQSSGPSRCPTNCKTVSCFDIAEADPAYVGCGYMIEVFEKLKADHLSYALCDRTLLEDDDVLGKRKS